MPFAGLHRLVGRVHKVAGPVARTEDGASRLQAFKATDERVRPLVDEINAVFWEADPETFQFLFVSRRAEQMLGYPLARWRGDPSFWFGLIHPEDRERVAARWRAAVQKEGDCELEYRAVAADRRVVTVRNIVHVVRDTAGRATLLRGVMLDISGCARSSAAPSGHTESPRRCSRHSCPSACQRYRGCMCTPRTSPGP